MAKGKMKKSLIFAVFFIAILVMALALAFVIQDLTTPLDIAHGTSDPGSFDIHNTAGERVINLAFEATGTYASWVDNFNGPAAIDDGDVQPVTFDVTVPEFTAPADYSITLKISGEGETFGDAFSDTEILTVTVLSPSLDMEDFDMFGYPKDNPTEPFIFTIENKGNSEANNVQFKCVVDEIIVDECVLTDSDDNVITLDFAPETDPLNILAGEEKDVDVTATIDPDMDYGKYSFNVIATASDGVNTTMKLSVRVKHKFCDEGQQGDRLIIKYIEDPDKDDDFTVPASIPVEVDVKNNYTDDDELDVVLEAEIWNVDEGTYVGGTREEVETEIDEGEKKALSLNLEIPIDIDERDNYIVLIKVYQDGKEDDQCVDDFVVVNINKNQHKVILDKATVIPEIVECDSEFSVQLKFGNAGEKDEDKVKVRIYNTNLEIDETKTTSIDEGEYDTVNFNLLHVPEDAEESEYVLNIEWFYDYDDDDDEYDESGNSEVTFTVEGNCIVPVYDVIISTQQLSGAKPDEEFTVKVTLTNTGTEETTYTISAIGYSGWATLESLDPETLTLEADEAGYTYIKLTPTETGSQEFTVRVEFEEQTETQDISVNVMSKSEAAGWFEQAWFTIKHNWEWVLVNAALAIAIIVLFILLLTKGHRHKPKHVYVVGGKGMARAKGPTEISLARTRTAKKTKARTRRKPRRKKR